jgi:hypothetical protein
MTTWLIKATPVPIISQPLKTLSPDQSVKHGLYIAYGHGKDYSFH